MSVDLYPLASLEQIEDTPSRLDGIPTWLEEDLRESIEHYSERWDLRGGVRWQRGRYGHACVESKRELGALFIE